MWFNICRNCPDADFKHNRPFCKVKKMSCDRVGECTFGNVFIEAYDKEKHCKHVTRKKLNKMHVRGKHKGSVRDYVDRDIDLKQEITGVEEDVLWDTDTED